MDYREIEQIQKVNKLKSKNDCLVCEVVVPEKFTDGPMSAVHGSGGNIEMAMLIKCLGDVIESLKRNFPDAIEIIPLLKDSGIKESYKHIETMGRK